MKKLLASTLAATLIAIAPPCAPYPGVHAATAAEYDVCETFDGFESGAYSSEYLIPEKKDAFVVQDGNNRLCRVNVTSETGDAAGSVFTTPNIAINGETVFSFKIRNARSSEGSVVASLRADRGSADEYKTIINFVKLADGVITYLPQMSPVAESISNDTMADITVTLNYNTGTIRVYRNGVLKVSVDDYRTVRNGSWADFYMESCLFRFQTIVKATPDTAEEPYMAETYLDDIIYCNDTVPDSGIVASGNTIYYKSESGIYSPVDVLKDGRLQSRVLTVNNSSDVRTVNLILAHKSGSELRDVSASDRVELQPGMASVVTCDITVDASESGDRLEAYLWDSAEGLRPLSLKSGYTRPAVENPITSELEYLFNKNGKGVHPRITASKADFDRIRNDASLNGWKQSVISDADAVLTANINVSGPDYIYYSTTSDVMLGVAHRVLDFMKKLGMAYQLTGDTGYSDKAYEIMTKAGEFPDWNPGHFLGTAEMTAAFAIGYDWMYDAFSDEQRSFIEGCILSHGLSEGKEAYDGTGDTENTGWWQMVNHNWNVVCNSGMIVGAVALADVCPDLCFEIIDTATTNLGYALRRFAPDGAWDEGYDYVEFILQTLSNAQSSVVNSFGTDFGIGAYPGMDSIGDFMIHMTGKNASNNLHDAVCVPVNTPELMWLAQVYDKPVYGAFRMKYIERNHLSPTPLDLIYYDSEYTRADAELNLDAHFGDMEYISHRSSWDENALWLSAHGGNVTVNHGHADCGSFVFEALGERWAWDLGPDTYTASGYFDENSRYLFYRARAEGHNVIVIDPDTSAGQELDGTGIVTRFDVTGTEPCTEMNLTSAYDTKADSVVRTFRLTDNRSNAVVEDYIKLKSSSNSVYWFMHTTADIIITDDNTAELTLNGKKLRVDFEVSSGIAVLTTEDAVPLTDTGVIQNSGNSSYRKLQLKVSGSEEFTITARLTPIV